MSATASALEGPLGKILARKALRMIERKRELLRAGTHRTQVGFSPA